MVGKWHLGFFEDGYDKPLPGGPVDRGFDSFFGIRASTDIPPYFYYVDAITIGLIGGAVGVAAAWVATHLENYVLYEFMVPAGVERIAVLRMPPWLAGAGVAFAINVSWVGGAYPAYRAARIDPVKALRHDGRVAHRFNASTHSGKSSRVRIRGSQTGSARSIGHKRIERRF